MAQVVRGVWSMDYDPNNSIIYAASYNGDGLILMDTKTDKVVGTIPVPDRPVDVKVDQITNTVLVTSLADNKITFVSPVRNQIIKTIQTG